jgi:hypothetical protein
MNFFTISTIAILEMFEQLKLNLSPKSDVVAAIIADSLNDKAGFVIQTETIDDSQVCTIVLLVSDQLYAERETEEKNSLLISMLEYVGCKIEDTDMEVTGFKLISIVLPPCDEVKVVKEEILLKANDTSSTSEAIEIIKASEEPTLIDVEPVAEEAKEDEAAAVFTPEAEKVTTMSKPMKVGLIVIGTAALAGVGYLTWKRFFR